MTNYILKADEIQQGKGAALLAMNSYGFICFERCIEVLPHTSSSVALK